MTLKGMIIDSSNDMYYGGSTAASYISTARQTDFIQLKRELEIKLEELERPCSLNFYINSTKVGTLSLLAQPPRGPFNGKFALGGTTATPDNKNETLTEVLESIRVEINKVISLIHPKRGLTKLMCRFF